MMMIQSANGLKEKTKNKKTKNYGSENKEKEMHWRAI